MEHPGRSTLKLVLVTLPWALLRFLGRLVRGFFVSVGVLVAIAVLGYVGFESIVEAVDAAYADEIDAHLGIDRRTIARLHDPAYFAQQSVLVTEDQKTVACISSPEHRILIDDVGDIPPLFVQRDPRLRRQELLHP